MEQCFKALRSANTQWILEGDIKSCFDKISHEWLLAHVLMDRVRRRMMLTTTYVPTGASRSGSAINFPMVLGPRRKCASDNAGNSKQVTSRFSPDYRRSRSNPDGHRADQYRDGLCLPMERCAVARSAWVMGK